jgi:hypothetical protein
MVSTPNTQKPTFTNLPLAGIVREGLFNYEDEEIDIDNIASAAESLLSQLNPSQKQTLSYHIDSPEWRTWSNPEFLLAHKGLRLDEQTPEIRDSILAILKATLSPEGYQKAISAMRINGFLGELVQGTKVMNEYSYNFVLFGEPSATQPWGWSFYGHHLCLNIFLFKRQIVISPWFTGAEPNEIDSGPSRGPLEQRRPTPSLRRIPRQPYRSLRRHSPLFHVTLPTTPHLFHPRRILPLPPCFLPSQETRPRNVLHTRNLL